jgi:hypothetical protein
MNNNKGRSDWTRRHAALSTDSWVLDPVLNIIRTCKHSIKNLLIEFKHELDISYNDKTGFQTKSLFK